MPSEVLDSVAGRKRRDPGVNAAGGRDSLVDAPVFADCPRPESDGKIAKLAVSRRKRP